MLPVVSPGKTVYTPAALVVTVTYAGAVPADPYAAQAVRFDAPGCANVYLAQSAEPVYGNESGDQLDAFGFGPVDSTRMRASYRIA